MIAGTAGGRRLAVPAGDQVRPTSDRTKEALFSILQPLLVGASVLDLFAGSGGLGIEALSRGAAHATFVERWPRAVETLKRNLDTTGLSERADIERGDALRRLEAAPLPGAPFDLVLLDPPYAIDRAQLDRVLVAAVAVARDGGTLSLELGVHGASPRWPPSVTLEQPRRYGDTRLHLARVHRAASAPPAKDP